jgi:hypothetical protein
MRNWTKLHQQKMKTTYGTESIRGGVPADIVLPAYPRQRKPPPSKEELRALAAQALIDWNATRRSS